MPLFGSQKKATDTHRQVSEMLAKVQSGGPIAEAALSATFEARNELGEKLPTLKSDPASDWAQLVELLGFCLHVADRHVFYAGGPSVRDAVLEGATELAAETLIGCCWDQSKGAPGFDTWRLNLKSETVEGLQAANSEYGQCKDFESAFLRMGHILVGRDDGAMSLDDYLVVATTVSKAMTASNLMDVSSSEGHRWKGKL
jgi:hypothetical protein